VIHSVVSVPLSRFGKDGYGFQSVPVWDVLVILVFDRFFLPKPAQTNEKASDQVCVQDCTRRGPS
jgi:hypothetical protein